MKSKRFPDPNRKWSCWPLGAQTVAVGRSSQVEFGDLMAHRRYGASGRKRDCIAAVGLGNGGVEPCA